MPQGAIAKGFIAIGQLFTSQAVAAVLLRTVLINVGFEFTEAGERWTAVIQPRRKGDGNLP